MSNKYIGRIGITAAELRDQTAALIQIAKCRQTPRSLLNTETKLKRGLYSKDYYEPVSEDVISAIPRTARNVLSIGCGSGATEKRLVERGLRVVAMPLDPVVSSGAAARGVEMINGDIDEIATLTRGEKFDCVLCLNVLHLTHDPAAVLSKLRDCLSDESTVIIQTPSMRSLRFIGRGGGDKAVLQQGYSSTGVHFSTVLRVRRWCAKSGMKVSQMIGSRDRQETGALGRIASAAGNFLPSRFSIFIATSIVILARRLSGEREKLVSGEASRTQRKERAPLSWTATSARK